PTLIEYDPLGDVHAFEDVPRGQRRRIAAELAHGGRPRIEGARFRAHRHEAHEQFREAAAAFHVKRVNPDGDRGGKIARERRLPFSNDGARTAACVGGDPVGPVSHSGTMVSARYRLTRWVRLRGYRSLR